MANRRHFSYIGYHGCEKELARRLILREVEMGKSANPYDWLGHGIYFWENDVKRALEFARDVKKCKEPFVIGAVLDLGYCLDLTCRDNLTYLKGIWTSLVEPSVEKGEVKLNKAPLHKGENGDLLLRYLDCRVINAMHDFNAANGFAPFDSVRAGFWEGEEIYQTAGFLDKNHIQICICNPNCIIGLLLPEGYKF